MSSTPQRLGAAESLSRPESRPKSRRKGGYDSPETQAFAKYLYENVFRAGMLPSLVLMTGFDESSIRRQLNRTQRLSRELSSVLLATMDRREAESLEEQHADAVRVRIRAELVAPGLKQLVLIPLPAGGAR